jgi:hypothetical protein
MSPNHEIPQPPKDGGFNFGSLEERMFVPQYLPAAVPSTGKAIGIGSPI